MGREVGRRGGGDEEDGAHLACSDAVDDVLWELGNGPRCRYRGVCWCCRHREATLTLAEGDERDRTCWPARRACVPAAGRDSSSCCAAVLSSWLARAVVESVGEEGGWRTRRSSRGSSRRLSLTTRVPGDGARLLCNAERPLAKEPRPVERVCPLPSSSSSCSRTFSSPPRRLPARLLLAVRLETMLLVLKSVPALLGHQLGPGER